MNFKMIFAALSSWTDHEEFEVASQNAVAAAEALDEAIASIPDRTKRDGNRRRIELLMKSLTLDGRNPLPVLLLVEEAKIYPHLAAKTISIAAEDAMDWFDGTAGLPADLADRRRGEALQALGMAAPMLHTAGRYQDSHKVFLDLMRLAPSRSADIRPWLAAHALSVGDIFHAVEALNAKETNPEGPFWSWAALLLNRLTRSSKSAKLLRVALEAEPLVRDHLLTLPPPPGTFAQAALVPGSDEEAQFHAGLLWRAWGAHPEHLQWLRERLTAPEGAAEVE